MKNIFLEKKNRRAFDHMQRACVEASVKQKIEEPLNTCNVRAQRLVCMCVCIYIYIYIYIYMAKLYKSDTHTSYTIYKSRSISLQLGSCDMQEKSPLKNFPCLQLNPTKILIITLLESLIVTPDKRKQKHKTQKLPSPDKPFLLLGLFLCVEAVFSASLNSQNS